MIEYIDREAAIQQMVFVHGRLDERYISESKLLAIPAADVVEHKQGEWNVRIFGRDGTDTYCSVCGKGGNRPYWNFCPNCGAEMKGR